MRNKSCVFGLLNQSLSRVHFGFLVFQVAMEMCIKGTTARYAAFIVSQSVLRSTVDMK